MSITFGMTNTLQTCRKRRQRECQLYTSAILRSMQGTQKQTQPKRKVAHGFVCILQEVAALRELIVDITIEFRLMMIVREIKTT